VQIRNDTKSEAPVIKVSSMVRVLNCVDGQSLGGQHGKGVDGLFEKVSFQTAFEGVKSG